MRAPDDYLLEAHAVSRGVNFPFRMSKHFPDFHHGHSIVSYSHKLVSFLIIIMQLYCSYFTGV